MLSFDDAAREIAAIGGRFYSRGWVLGTSGNFSAVVARDPLRLAITASTAHKGHLSADDIIEIAASGRVLAGDRRPSAETLVHLGVIKATGAGAVLHTHSVWATILSDLHVSAGALTIEGFEMLKGLEGITTHEHRERIPILRNDQDMTRLGLEVHRVLDGQPAIHAFLIHRHGLYTWGRTLADAERHVEILEFLFETLARHNQQSVPTQ
jgi:methylthioribulose-1-phosphate dehydratase